MRILAIDLGTSGVKVAVIGETGPTLGSASERLETVHTADGGAVQDAEEWWAALGRATRAALAAAGTGDRIGGIAVTAQYLSTVAVDRHGRPLSPVITWMDHRGGPDHPLKGDDVAVFTWLERHGLPPLSNDGLAHIAWLRRNDPTLVERGAWFVEPVDAIVARLTGRVTATQNSAFGLMAIDNRTHGQLSYDDELLATAGIDPAWLPELVPMDAPVGELTADAAGHLGVEPGLTVLPGTIDSITSAVGSGAIGPQHVSLVIGTTSVLVSHVPAMQADLDNSITSVPSPVGGQYFVMAENGVGGKALDHLLRDVIYADDPLSLGGIPDDAFARAEAAARLSPPGSGGVLYFPWLVGSMSPAPDDRIRAGFANVGVSTRRADLVRAVYEGVALNAAWLFGPVCAFTGHEHHAIRFGGGAARSTLWSQVLADALGVTVDRLADPATTNARGAALLALVQLGRLGWGEVPELLRIASSHEPDPARVARYAELRQRLIEYHGLTRGFHATLPERP